MTAQAAEFHAGTIHLREDTPWVGDLVAELLGFPGMRHDDQVDALSQLGVKFNSVNILVDDELRLGVLVHEADRVGEVARAVGIAGGEMTGVWRNQALASLRAPSASRTPTSRGSSSSAFPP